MVRSSIRRILLTALSIMVHEFGHFSNLAHTQTNGGILLGLAVGVPEPSGPAPFNTFGAPTVADFVNNELLETMYPFFFGTQFGEESLALDDIDVDLAAVSRGELLRDDRQRGREHLRAPTAPRGSRASTSSRATSPIRSSTRSRRCPAISPMRPIPRRARSWEPTASPD